MAMLSTFNAAIVSETSTNHYYLNCNFVFRGEDYVSYLL
jgi:hypothetical protein